MKGYLTSLDITNAIFPSYRTQSVNLLFKSTDWLVYDGNIGRLKVNLSHQSVKLIIDRLGVHIIRVHTESFAAPYNVTYIFPRVVLATKLFI